MLDLLGETDLPSLDTNGTAPNAANTFSPTANLDILDLLGDINMSAPVMNTQHAFSSNSNTTQTLFGGALNDPSPIGDGLLFNDDPILSNNNDVHAITPSLADAVKLVALDKNGINVTLVPQKNFGCLQVLMTATNASPDTVEQFLFQAAVPKSFALQMLSPSGTLLPPGGVITQEMQLTNSAKVSGAQKA